MLEKEGLTLATDRLHYFSHWVTPEPLPIRYDVRFFVAEAPKGQEALHDGHELVGHIWVTPQEALDAYHRGDFKLVLPTIMTLKELCAFGTVEDVVLATKGKNIPRILTKMEHKEGRTVEIMPDGPSSPPRPARTKTCEEVEMKKLSELFSLKGKTALITGGGRGIGKFIATGLAEAGADLIVTSRKMKNLEATAEEISATYGVQVLPVACDVARAEDIEAW